jgi:imidazolonepropionase-like amidohydrolase
MKFTAKDTVGLALVAGTLGALLVHIGPDGHDARHPTAVADAGGSVTTAASATTVAFVDVNVVPMEGNTVLRRQVVIVEDGFIRRIGPFGAIEPPPGAQIVNGGGTRYLMPGLTDAHVHLPEGSEDWLSLFVANGVTTVFNLKGDDSHVRMRDQIRAGEILGPTVYTSGPFTNEPLVRTPEDAARAVRDQIDRGYDFVKIHGDLSAETFLALVEAGRQEGIPVLGHAPRNLPFSAVLESGQVAVVHAEELIYTHFNSLETRDLDGLAADMARAGTWLTPTLSTFGNIATQWGTMAGVQEGLRTDVARYLPESLRQEWLVENPYTGQDPNGRNRIEAMYQFQHPMIRAFNQAGIPMLTGTDTPSVPVVVPGFSLHDEIEALTAAGLSRYDALAAATRNAGMFVRKYVDPTASFGTVTAGARADLILLDEDPLADLDRLRRPSGVMLRGQWFSRVELDRMLESAAGNR